MCVQERVQSAAASPVSEHTRERKHGATLRRLQSLGLGLGLGFGLGVGLGVGLGIGLGLGLGLSSSQPYSPRTNPRSRPLPKRFAPNGLMCPLSTKFAGSPVSARSREKS